MKTAVKTGGMDAPVSDVIHVTKVNGRSAAAKVTAVEAGSTKVKDSVGSDIPEVTVSPITLLNIKSETLSTQADRGARKATSRKRTDRRLVTDIPSQL